MEGWYALVAFVIAWLVAQISKTVIGLLGGRGQERKMSFGDLIDYFTRSGGMPSGHTASFTAVTLYFGLELGFGSGIFALALCTLMVVVYDATHVRYAVGEQGKALNGLLRAEGKEELPVVEGHTIPQVIGGAIIGLLVGWLVFMIVGSMG